MPKITTGKAGRSGTSGTAVTTVKSGKSGKSDKSGTSTSRSSTRSRGTPRAADEAPLRSSRRAQPVTGVTSALPGTGVPDPDEPPAKATPAKIPPPVVVDHPGQSEAQIAAGPHRPEPATPLSHTPVGPIEPVVPDGTRARGAGSARILVRATADGYYGDARRRAGSLFDLTDAAAFAPSWMQHVTERAAGAPAKTGKAGARKAGAKTPAAKQGAARSTSRK